MNAVGAAGTTLAIAVAVSVGVDVEGGGRGTAVATGRVAAGTGAAGPIPAETGRVGRGAAAGGGGHRCPSGLRGSIQDRLTIVAWVRIPLCAVLFFVSVYWLLFFLRLDSNIRIQVCLRSTLLIIDSSLFIIIPM